MNNSKINEKQSNDCGNPLIQFANRLVRQCPQSYFDLTYTYYLKDSSNHPFPLEIQLDNCPIVYVNNDFTWYWNVNFTNILMGSKLIALHDDDSISQFDSELCKQKYALYDFFKRNNLQDKENFYKKLIPDIDLYRP